MARPKSPLSKYIESLAFDLPTADVVRRAKEYGFVTSESNVVRVRALARKAAKQSLSPRAAPAPTAKAPANPKPTPPPAAVLPREQEIKRLVLELGIVRAEAIIAEVRAVVSKFFAS